jgi:hypothetical protein
MNQFLVQLSDNDIEFAAVIIAPTPEDAAQTLADHLVAEDNLPADDDWFAADIYQLVGTSGVMNAQSVGLFVLSRRGGRGVVRSRD